MGCGQGCIKLVLIVINVIFFLAGGAILAGGLYVRFEPSLNSYAEAAGLNILTQELYTASYILIAFGAFTFVVGFLGCCGAMKDNKCMIGLYITMVLLILGAEIGGGVFVYINKDTYINQIEEKALDYLKKDYANNSTLVSDLGWNTAMETLKCCGVNGQADFQSPAFNANRKSRIVPNSCCKKKDDEEAYVDEVKCQIAAKKNETSSDYLNTVGCKQAVEDLLVQYSTLLLGIAIGVAVFECLVVIMAIGFCCNIDK